MTKFNPDFQQEIDEETLEKLQNLEDFAEQFLDEDFISFNPNISVTAALALNKLPIKLREYLKQIVEIKEQIAKERTQNRSSFDPIKKEEERKNREKKIEKLAQEIFIISCASSKATDEKKTLEFLEKFNLAKRLNEVGENGLSPVSATMVSAKSPVEKEKTLTMLLEAGAKISAQDLDVAGAAKVKVTQENSPQKDERNRPQKKLNSQQGAKQNLEQKERLESLLKKNIDELAALEFKMEILALYEEMKMRLRQERKREQEAKAFITELEKSAQKTATTEPEKFAPETAATESEKSAQKTAEKEPEKFGSQTFEDQKHQKTSQRRILELSKILGIFLDERTINSMLFSAVESSQSAMAMLLVGYGADVNYAEKGKSVMELAINGGNNSLISVFLDRANPETKLRAFRANSGNENFVRIFESKTSAPDAEQKSVDDSRKEKSDSQPEREVKTSLKRFDTAADWKLSQPDAKPRDIVLSRFATLAQPLVQQKSATLVQQKKEQDQPRPQVSGNASSNHKPYLETSRSEKMTTDQDPQVLVITKSDDQNLFRSANSYQQRKEQDQRRTQVSSNDSSNQKPYLETSRSEEAEEKKVRSTSDAKFNSERNSAVLPSKSPTKTSQEASLVQKPKTNQSSIKK